VRKELNDGSLFRNLERAISHDDEKSVQLVCSRVFEWAASAVLEDTLNLDDFSICQGEKKLSYIVHKELRRRFPHIWTFQDIGRVSKFYGEHYNHIAGMHKSQVQGHQRDCILYFAV
jgi:hypothetical protein